MLSHQISTYHIQINHFWFAFTIINITKPNNPTTINPTMIFIFIFLQYIIFSNLSEFFSKFTANAIQLIYHLKYLHFILYALSYISVRVYWLFINFFIPTPNSFYNYLTSDCALRTLSTFAKSLYLLANSIAVFFVNDLIFSSDSY